MVGNSSQVNIDINHLYQDISSQPSPTNSVFKTVAIKTQGQEVETMLWKSFEEVSCQEIDQQDKTSVYQPTHPQYVFRDARK